MDIFDEYEMQTVEVVGDFYSSEFQVQQSINLHTLTNQFKQVLRHFSGLTSVALTGSFASRIRPFEGVGVGQWGVLRYSYSRVATHGVLRLVNQ